MASNTQSQAPGYRPKPKSRKGYRIGSQNSSKKRTPKKVGNNNKRIQNRKGRKTTKANNPKSIAMNNSFQNIQPQSNMPGFNFPGSAPLL